MWGESDTEKQFFTLLTIAQQIMVFERKVKNFRTIPYSRQVIFVWWKFFVRFYHNRFNVTILSYTKIKHTKYLNRSLYEN